MDGKKRVQEFLEMTAAEEKAYQRKIDALAEENRKLRKWQEQSDRHLLFCGFAGGMAAAALLVQIARSLADSVSGKMPQGR